jgi:hypothetical protein
MEMEKLIKREAEPKDIKRDKKTSALGTRAEVFSL